MSITKIVSMFNAWSREVELTAKSLEIAQNTALSSRIYGIQNLVKMAFIDAALTFQSEELEPESEFPDSES